MFYCVLYIQYTTSGLMYVVVWKLADKDDKASYMPWILLYSWAKMQIHE